MRVSVPILIPTAEDALGMLGDLSQLGGGSLIHVKNARQAEGALLDEIKQRSHK